MVWDQTRIQSLIDQQVQESLTIEYKAAGALEKTDKKRTEITKDVSAMANSAGGVLVYGVTEYQRKDMQHLPEKIDPIDRIEYPKEWLEQIINNIRPRITGLIIYPVNITNEPNHVIYVVEIPQSDTAHQAMNKRYYKRFNFESVAMDDYEIRDIMRRNQQPHIELNFEIHVTEETRTPYLSDEAIERCKYVLVIHAENDGRAYAQYVNSFITLPERVLPSDRYSQRKVFEEEGIFYSEHYRDNTVRDVMEVEMIGTNPVTKYGPSRFDPVLPSLSVEWQIPLNDNFHLVDLDDLLVRWRTYADNAPMNWGEVKVQDIPIMDERDRTNGKT
jgi:hypothetical protein